MSEYEERYGRLDATQAFAVHAFWTMISGKSHQDARRVTNAIIQDRQSTVLLHAAPDRGEPFKPKILSYKQMITTGALQNPPVLSQAAAGDAFTKEKAAKERKVDALFHLLLEDVLDLAELGLSTEQIQDPGVEQVKDTVMSQPSQLSTNRLGALQAVETFRCGQLRVQPCTLAIGRVPEGGQQRWTNSGKMGMKLGLQHFLVKPFQSLYLPSTALSKPLNPNSGNL